VRNLGTSVGRMRGPYGTELVLDYLQLGGLLLDDKLTGIPQNLRRTKKDEVRKKSYLTCQRTQRYLQRKNYFARRARRCEKDQRS